MIVVNAGGKVLKQRIKTIQAHKKMLEAKVKMIQAGVPSAQETYRRLLLAEKAPTGFQLITDYLKTFTVWIRAKSMLMLGQ